MTPTSAGARTVLVTGASGFVGRQLAAALAAAGWQVTGLDLAPPPAVASRSYAAFWSADLLDEASLSRLTVAAPFQAVVHLAGLLPGTAARHQLFAVNVGGTSATLSRFAGPGCHFVLFSSGLVYGDQPGPFVEQMACRPLDAYGQSKLAAEAIVEAWGRATGSPVTLLRPSVLYGPGAPARMLLLSLMDSLRREVPFEMTAGEQRRDFLHVNDAAAAVVAVLDRRAGGIWNLASGESRTVREAAQLGAAVAGRPDLLRVGALPYRANEVFDYRLAASALRGSLDWRPRTNLADGLEDLWRAMR